MTAAGQGFLGVGQARQAGGRRHVFFQAVAFARNGRNGHGKPAGGLALEVVEEKPAWIR